ncbi:MAG: dihydropteroate synthase [Woeseiaceae bacterium]
MQQKTNRLLADATSPAVMGVLNVTPDSFSDGGQFLSADKALARAAAMVDAGVDIIDVGGESTRPGAEEISVQEELDRMISIVEGIAKQLDVVLSVDTSKPEIMRAAEAAGATMINDVYALRRPGAMQAAASLESMIVLMHMQGEPGSMQKAPRYNTLPGDVIDFLADRVSTCVESGIDRERLIVDPGFGFGKNDRHNVEILAKLEQFADLRLPLLVGLSRKKTLGNLTGRSVQDRGAAGIAAALVAVQKGASIVRTHDVAATIDALAVLQAVVESG